MPFGRNGKWVQPDFNFFGSQPTVRGANTPQDQPPAPPTAPQSSMYSAPQDQSTNQSAGMYSTPASAFSTPAPAAGISPAYNSTFGAPTGFTGQAGGSLQVGDITQQFANELPAYQADQALRASQAASLAQMYGADRSLEGSNFGNLTGLAGTGLQTDAQRAVAQTQAGASNFGNYTGLLGTGLQTEAQKAVANTNVQPALQKLAFTQGTVFPFIQSFLGTNGTNGGGLNSQLMSSVLSAADPAHEQAALNSAEANAARGAETAQQQGLRQVAGSGWSPSSPVGAALTAASSAGRVGAEEEAKRQIRDQYGQQRVANLAQAINAQSQQMNPIYSLLASLMS